MLLIYILNSSRQKYFEIGKARAGRPGKRSEKAEQVLAEGWDSVMACARKRITAISWTGSTMFEKLRRKNT